MKINALMIRQSFGKILKYLIKNNEPIVIEKNRKPVAVLISIEMFERRFVDKQEEEKRKEILFLVRESGAEVKENSTKILRELRYGRDN